MLKLTFRGVEYKDIWALYSWRREPQTEFWSLEAPLTSDKHYEWMRTAVKNEHLYIAELNDNPAAVCSVSPGNEVGVTVNPYLRRKGIGRECIRFLQSRYPALTATIVVGNTASLRLFVGCGFDIKDADYIHHRPCILLEWLAEEAT